MYISLSSTSVSPDDISISEVDKKYHNNLGVVSMSIVGVGTIYIDYDSAVKMREEITRVLDEYMVDETATYSTTSIDPREVEE